MAACGDDVSVPDVECEEDCFLAPEPVCDGDISTTFQSPGECGENGTCEYDTRVETCEFGCGSGICRPDPCAAVSCPVPPRPACEGDILVTTRVGACTEGACVYPESRLDCASLGQVCASGACVDVDPCEGLDCTTTPGPTCSPDGRGVLTSSAGRCVEGLCEYSTSVSPCTGETPVCVDGSCQEDPLCVDVDCDTPPDGFCAERVATNFVNGTCVGGVCEWEPAETDCRRIGQICEDAACEPIPCAEVDCLVAPDDFCDEGEVAVDFTGAGECRSDVCVYASLRTDCAARGEVCEDGRCIDPCAGVTCDSPPADSCAESGVATNYPAGGLCVNGTCEYEPQVTDCDALDLVCASGRCVTECAVAACDSPEPDVCAGPVTIDAGVFPGDCDGGVCSYGRETLVCPESTRCLDGACVDVVGCSENADCEPPEPFCVGNVVYEFGGATSCDEGACTLDEVVSTVDCGETDQFCVEGACEDADPCIPLACTPPTATCAGTVAVTYGPGLECGEGVCDYERTNVNCAETAQQCVDGACVDLSLCDGVECSVTPASVCASATAVREFSAAGTCDATTGTCVVDAPFTDTECASSGSCVNGVCAGTPAYGDLVITELSLGAYPGLNGWQWIEVYNASGQAIPARALTLRSGTGSERTVESDGTIPPGGYTVLASQNGGFSGTPYIGWTAANPFLNASTGTVEIRIGDTLLDSVTYGVDGWPLVIAGSFAVDGATDADDNDIPERWCASDESYGGSYRGSPGAENASCVPVIPPPP